MGKYGRKKTSLTGRGTASSSVSQAPVESIARIGARGGIKRDLCYHGLTHLIDVFRRKPGEWADRAGRPFLLPEIRARGGLAGLFAGRQGVGVGS